jgi:hypothetical protein
VPPREFLVSGLSQKVPEKEPEGRVLESLNRLQIEVGRPTLRAA